MLLVPSHSYRWWCSKIVVARNINSVRCLQLLCSACAEFNLTKQERFLLAAHAIYAIIYFSEILERRTKMSGSQVWLRQCSLQSHLGGLSYPCSPGHRSRPPRRSPRGRCSSWGKAPRCRRHPSRKEPRSCGSCSPGSSGIGSYCTGKTMVLLLLASGATAPRLRLKGPFPKFAICK